MSRIGKMPVEIPVGVDVNLTPENFITVKGPKGTLSRQLVTEIDVAIEGAVINVTRPNDLKKFRSLHGLTRTLISNMMVGVTQGYQKTLNIVGTGYRAAKAGNKLTLTLGYSHPVEMTDPEGVEATVEGNTTIHVAGIDKEKVGQYAADIRAKRAPEPYKGKGIKYSTERIRRKAGKSGKK
ncbi:MAG: 50S ribosomal protein L6 [Defluviitaleaceae bacterium]|nr:50S ribosomal protein L6 [Defluviitaleaceae bacterium]